MHREGEVFPRTTTQAPSPSEKRRARGSPPFSPLLTQSQGSVRCGEEARTRRPPGPCPPLLVPSGAPPPPIALCGWDPPMATSRLLGAFHASVIIFPVTATTCGAPSGGPGTTSESDRSTVRWVLLGSMAPQDHQASRQWAGGRGQSHGGRGKASRLPRGTEGEGAGVEALPSPRPLGGPEARLCTQLTGRVPASPHL